VASRQNIEIHGKELLKSRLARLIFTALAPVVHHNVCCSLNNLMARSCSADVGHQGPKHFQNRSPPTFFIGIGRNDFFAHQKQSVLGKLTAYLADEARLVIPRKVMDASGADD
jgi:hypothetical protein